MNRRKLLVFALALCMVFALCGCQKDEQTPDALGSNTTHTTPSDQQGQDNQGGTQQSGGSSVDFGLQPAPDPDFDSPASGGSNDKMYTIQGDYAYEMDPNTLSIVGPPLDPITHQPVDNPVLEGSNPSTPNNPQDVTPPAEEPPAQEPDPEPVKPETKLPNTGMFLEDD